MKKTVTLIATTLLAVNLVGCADMGGSVRKQDIGMVTGGVLGGVLGNQVGGGNGRIAATIGGTLLGAYLGGSIGKSMDDTDRMRVNQTLETTPTGRTSAWSNPDGVQYRVTPERTYTNNEGTPCREYTTRAFIDGKWQQAHGTACRAGDGSWEIRS